MMENEMLCYRVNYISKIAICSGDFIEGEECPEGYKHLGPPGYLYDAVSLCPIPIKGKIKQDN